MKKFTFQHETPDHFVMHNGVSHFHIAKKGLDIPTADKIRAFANGGNTTAGDITQSENKKNMKKIDANIEAAKHYSEGGETKDTDLAPPAQANLDDIYKPTELPEPEKQEKRRTVEEEMPEPEKSKGNYAEGGQLTAEARKHIAPKNFALPNGRYPIEDANHARNALARVSQHGSPEEKAEVRAKVHTKYPGIEQHLWGGGSAATSPEVTSAVRSAASNPQNSTPQQDSDEETARQAKYAKIRETNTENMTTGNYAGGGSIANETQDQAIKRYADGNPATLAKGGPVAAAKQSQIDSGHITPSHTHHNAGKNQLHFHFYDGANPSPQSKVPHLADGGDPADAPMSDSDKLSSAADQVQQDTSNQDAMINSAAQASAAGPTPNAVSPAVNQIPAAQQISAAPKAAAPTPDQNPTMLSDLDKSIALQTQGIAAGAQAQAQGMQNTATAIGAQVMQQKARADAYQLASDNLTKQNNQLFQAVSSSTVDPNRFWSSMSTGGKIAASIGILLGGIAGGINRTHENVVLNQLNNHVQQDIEAQKMDQSNKMNLYKMGLEKYKDQQSAEQFATLQSNALLQGQLQKIAAQTGSQTAMATAQQMIGQIGIQNTNLRAELAMKQAAMNVMNAPQQQTGVNPNNLRLLVGAGVIPKEEVPTAMKEYGDYQKLNTILDHTDQVFKTAGQNANYRERISQSLPFGSHIPTVTDASKKYQAVTQDWLGNITKETEGRVTPTDVDLMRPSLPQPGDSPEVAATKINNIKDQIKEKYSFPTLQSYKILHPNDPLAQSSATRQKRFTESKPQ